MPKTLNYLTYSSNPQLNSLNLIHYKSVFENIVLSTAKNGNSVIVSPK